MTNLQTLHARLEDAAYKITDNFCYGCYKVVKGDYCPTCHSDDFMRHLEGVGVEYGTEWVIEHLIEQNCQAVDGKEMFEDMLSGEGHKVDIAYNGKQGLDIFNKKQFDLVFTDLAMPGMSGWQVAKRIKEMNNRMPVVLITGWELKPAEIEDDKKNVDIIIKKPFTVTDVTGVIKDILPGHNRFSKKD